MSQFVANMTAKAVKLQKRLVLPEGHEPRTVQAARKIKDQSIASKVILVGKKETVEETASRCGVSLNGIIVSDPSQSPDLDRYAEEFYQLRKHKGITLDQARSKITEILNWGAMMVRMNDADAMVAGADNPTGQVLLSGFTIIKTAPGVKSASSCFVMDFPDKKWGKDGLMIFADCATIPDPTAEQLAEIAIQSSISCKTFLQTEPLVALLSFSTKGSAEHPNVDKVREALKIVKEKAPDLHVDGEMQADAALIPGVGEKKAPGSTVAGKANTLVFPDLQSGNIGYKLVQRFADAGAYGPFLQGFAKPISDLSRGCSIDDIVTTCAVTLTQADG